jgi:hypothetical protein
MTINSYDGVVAVLEENWGGGSRYREPEAAMTRFGRAPTTLPIL